MTDIHMLQIQHTLIATATSNKTKPQGELVKASEICPGFSVGGEAMLKVY